MLTARQENERTLARLAGISEDEAARRLTFTIAVRAGGEAAQPFARHLRELLDLTLEVVDEDEPAELELAVNIEPSGKSCRALCIRIDEDGMDIYAENPATVGSDTQAPHDLAAKLAACYAAGVAINLAVSGPRLDRLTFPFSVRFATLGMTPELLKRSVVLSDTVLVGAGGVANGFIWAAESIDVHGDLQIADPKSVSPGNLNRARYFSPKDIDTNKAVALAANAKLANLTLEPFAGTFKDLRRQRGRSKRVIVTVDSRPARRAIQSELPLEVLDASTTDVSEVVIHSHAQPNDGACLSCIYHHIPLEDERLRSVAEGLGLAFDDIRDKEFLDEELTERLAELHGLDAAAIQGKAITSLYKELCAAESLKTAAGGQALAPFAFVSHLAGVLLAAELLRFEADREAAQSSNYLALDPWSPPHGRLRRTRSKHLGCEFCGSAESTYIMSVVWPEWFSPPSPDDATHVA